MQESNERTANLKEQWKDIPNTDGFYQVSSHGRVRSWHNNTMTPGRRDEPRILKQNMSAKHGYPSIMIRNSNERWTALVHRLVIEAFVPNPQNKPQTNHKDGNKENNHVHNLEWATRSENQSHGHENGLMNPPKGKDHWSTNLTETDVIDMRNAYRTGWFTQKEIAEAYGIHRTAANMIINKKRWAHV